MSSKIAYTKDEVAIINHAFQDLNYVVENKVGGSLERNFDKALKAARTQAHNLTEARAWVVRAFARGVEASDTMLAKDLDGLAEWWLFGILTGVGYVARGVQQSDPIIHARMFQRVKACIVAHDAARTRQLEAL